MEGAVGVNGGGVEVGGKLVGVLVRFSSEGIGEKVGVLVEMATSVDGGVRVSRSISG